MDLGSLEGWAEGKSDDGEVKLGERRRRRRRRRKRRRLDRVREPSLLFIGVIVGQAWLKIRHVERGDAV